MKYTGKLISEKESLEKHSDFLKSGETIFATSDGNAFTGESASVKARSHAVNYRPALDVYPLKKVSKKKKQKTN